MKNYKNLFRLFKKAEATDDRSNIQIPVVGGKYQPPQKVLRKTCGQRLSSKQKDYVVDVEVNGGEQLSVSRYICESGSFSSHLGY